ncbi:hypothetical protein BZL30_4135 [Mycobacterium kansasii]|uniref:Uncharacterized protein n=1 Tax=Mycobacterium kansasii TaxID=1768 RepID=A0A1V3X9B9_MYCKA|nr:hypothetical protein BZL30_4135 [Mycobacterium kansasii]
MDFGSGQTSTKVASAAVRDDRERRRAGHRGSAPGGVTITETT